MVAVEICSLLKTFNFFLARISQTWRCVVAIESMPQQYGCSTYLAGKSSKKKNIDIIDGGNLS